MVGDIQGCAPELEDLLAAIRFDPGTDELVCVGDLVNRGPDSVGVLRLLDEIGARSVLGNHEVYALRVASGRAERQCDSLDALYGDPEADRWLAWLRAGQALELAVDETGRTVIAEVHTTGAAIDPVSQSVSVRASISASDASLVPGMSGTVRFIR